MSDRTCTIAGCTAAHLAKGYCKPHYAQAYRKAKPDMHHPKFERVCETCGTKWSTPRREARFCTAKCKGAHLAVINLKSCPLPPDHPVRMLISEARATPLPQRPPTSRPTPTAGPRTPRECPSCGSWFSPVHASAATQMVTCSSRCKRKRAKRIRRARTHGAAGTWTWSEFMRIARRFGYACAYCGTKPERLDPDHVLPLARGGQDSPTNLLPACAPCNSSKCAMTLNEWADWRARRGLPFRRVTWAAGDLRYIHLTVTSVAA